VKESDLAVIKLTPEGEKRRQHARLCGEGTFASLK
jgi:hypothetical protein